MKAIGSAGMARTTGNRTWQDILLAAPWLTVLISLLPLFWFVYGLTLVQKDSSVDAFVANDHPAVAARDFARETFGIEDPIIVVFAEKEGKSALNEPLLSALRAFTEEVQEIGGVAPGVMSLASKRAIVTNDAGDLEAPLIVGDPIDPEAAEQLVASMPPFQGTLIAHTGDALAAIVPVDDPNHAEQVVSEVRNLAQRLAPPGVEVHLTGVATMNSRLAERIADDTKVFLPLAAVVIALFLLWALKRPTAIIAPFIVVAGAAIVAVGSIGLMDGRYYLITTALPVVVMAIAVADSIHLTLAFQRQRRLHPELSRRAAMGRAMRDVATPIILTSVTTALGFLGLAVGSPMVPVAEFGLVAAAGTMAAGVLSLTFLPAVQVYLADRKGAGTSASWMDRILRGLATASAERPLLACILTGFFLAVALAFALQVRFDYERDNYFLAGDPVLQADQILQERFDGGNVVDLIVDTGEDGGLLTADAVAKVDDLQQRFEALEGIRTVSAFSEQISLMHERLTGAQPGSLPTSDHAPAEYMLLYEASGEPEDFDNQIDFGRRYTRLRGHAATGKFSANEPLVEELASIAADASADTGIDVQVSGRLAVNDGWMKALRASHARTIGAAVLFVFIATVVVLSSLRQGLIAIVPVMTGILLLYAAMAVFGIDLAPATSMCAAIAAGLGVDFGIHLTKALKAEPKSPGQLLPAGYDTVMRACLFSALSLAAGFCVVATSGTPVLRWFGLLIASSAVGSLLGALILIPALTALYQRGKQKAHA
ncbi:efflux RND transporter permease subunit [Parvularcula lutaonensis]|uniref:RND family transporter n=1 Tax=Parvularcula lutaonensis TaxID=491923 RepID=A0ABV7M953_9PROT|nr:MMPL family transporter [Parvularcula lutaonensis]GGY45637.1 RND transporter [Parvularcula lutaonensis]